MPSNHQATRIIVSDLHLGMNDSFDIFKSGAGRPDKTALFTDFLKWCGTREGPVELIINGDFVDFLQLRPWDSYGNRGEALQKIGRIAAGNAGVFHALGAFLQDARHRIVVLLGNHDVELAYDEVWAVIQQAITGSAVGHDRLEFHSRDTQHNFHVGGVLVHVEHGNKGDAYNEILYTELFNDAVKNSGFHFPPGTKFVYEVMNGFKETHQFVDLLKPEVPAVPLLLARLRPLKSLAKLPGTVLNIMQAVQQGFLGAVRRRVGGGAFGPDEKVDPLYVEMAEAYVQQASSGNVPGFSDLDADHLVDFLDQEDLETAAPVSAEPAFGRRMERVKTAFVESILKHLGRPARMDDRTFYQTDQTGKDVDRAAREFVGDVRVVVFGHTHGALKSEIPGKRLYLNSGTWANLVELPPTRAEFSKWLKTIADNTFERTAYPTYITLAPADGGVRATLGHWSTTGEDILWTKNI